MSYEVELKFRVATVKDLRHRLESLKGFTVGIQKETDSYLRHPSRAFEKTDEALRVRQVDGAIQMTYKGPKVDAETKTRIEIELELAHGRHSVAQVIEFWHRLGFSLVREVRKSRELIDIPWQGRTVRGSLDRVEGLGEFLELELLAQPEQMEESRQLIQKLAKHLGLEESERRSYLELLLEKVAAAADMPEKIEDWSE